VVPGEITSQKGWVAGPDAEHLAAAVGRLKGRGVRVSLFVEPDEEALRFAASVGADRVELYTEPFARAWEDGEAEAIRSFNRYASSARAAHALGLGVNAGHDLDLQNLVLFRTLPHLAEVSIGHAIVSRALFVGLETVVREYLAVLAGASGASASPPREVD
jgi:pyridoxine 5-phosphate synthase